MKRLPNESFEDYKERRKADQQTTKQKLRGRLFWRAGHTVRDENGLALFTMKEYRNPKNAKA